MRMADGIRWIATGLVAIALTTAVPACGGSGGTEAGGSAGGSASPTLENQAAEAPWELKEPDSAQYSRSPSPTSSPTASSTPSPRRPSRPKLIPVSHVWSGGVRGIHKITIDSAGRWQRTGKGSGTLTDNQVTTLNRLLGSASLAREAKNYAAANRKSVPCDLPIAQTLTTPSVTLRKSTCDSNHIATPTYDELLRLLYQYTGG